MVVLETETRKNTKGKLFPVTEYKLMKRGQYANLENPLAMTPDLKSVPLEMYEARNAVEIAKSRGADKYAPDIFSKAQASLSIAESSLAKKADKKQIISTAKQAVQFSEDARALSAEHQEQETHCCRKKPRPPTRPGPKRKPKLTRKPKRQAEITAAKQAQMKAEADAEAKRQADLADAKTSPDEGGGRRRRASSKNGRRCCRA